MAVTPKKGAKRGLGKGFDALIPRDFDRSILLEAGEKIQKITVTSISPHKGQPRTTFDTDALEQLASSIKQYGVLQPIIVRPAAKSDKVDSDYIIVAGERRWRASQLAGQTTIPAIVRTLKDLEHMELALVENVQRVDLSPLEQAVSIENLHQQFNLNYEAIAKRLGKAVSTVHNMVRLLQLPEAARTALENKQISEGHARSILALKGKPEAQAELLDSIIAHDWSVRQAERFVTSLKQGVNDQQVVRQRVETETPVTKALSKRIQAPVHIRRTAKGGRLELGFTTDDELNRLLSLLDKIK